MVGPLSPVPIMTETSLRYAGDTTDAEWGSPDAHESSGWRREGLGGDLGSVLVGVRVATQYSDCNISMTARDPNRASIERMEAT